MLLHQVSSNQTTGKLSGIGKHAMNAFFLRLNGNNEYRPDTRCDAADGGGAPGSKSGARRQHNEIAKLVRDYEYYYDTITISLFLPSMFLHCMRCVVWVRTCALVYISGCIWQN